MIKLIIFDLDGTLLDTIHDLATATNMVLAKHGYPTHPTQDYHYFVGDGIVKLIERALPPCACTPANIEQVRAEQIDYYTAHMFDSTKPFEGICDALTALAAQGVSLAVLTNKPDAPAQELVRRFFPDISFDQIAGQRVGVPTKPDPTAVNRMIQQANVLKEEVLYLGDSDVDMLTAANAGVRGIGVLWGYRTKDELQKAGAYAVIDKVEELLLLPAKNS